MASTRSTLGTCRTRSRGVTLLELMITVAIMAILGALALPSFESAIQSNRVATTSNAFLASVAFARAEAMRSNNHNIGMCPSADGVACSTAVGFGDWHVGWIVFPDLDGGGLREAATEPVLVRQGALHRQTLRRSTGARATRLRFSPRGTLSRPEEYILQPVGCKSGDPFVRVITLMESGAVRIAKQDCP